MTRGLVYKGIFILAIILFSVALILPTVGVNTMRVTLEEGIADEDLQVINKRFPTGKYDVTREKGTILISGYNINDAVMNEVVLFKGVRKARLEKHWAEKYLLAKKVTLGLDLQGGMHLVMRANYEKIEKKQGKALTEAEKTEITNQALELIRNRVDKFGIAEPSIRPRGTEAIEIQLPGVKNPADVKKAIGTTGRVEYRIVDEQYSALADEWRKKNGIKDFPAETEKQDEMLEKMAKDIQLPDTLEALYLWDRKGESKKLKIQQILVLQKDVALAGNDISRAWVGRDEYEGLAVHFQTTAEGASKFAEVTAKKNHGKRLAIVIDDKVRSAPSMHVQITTGNALINGNFTYEEVQTLARIIKEGALPVDLKIIEERTVGPSLGQDSIESGYKAIMLALAVVALFMLVYYKLGGLISDIGLMLNAVFMLAILSWMGFTLTLPGFAGFILSAGMAVDANVIVYERIKEELRAGKSVRTSIKLGYTRAFWAIFDGNITTILAAFVLLQFGTGSIRGFAVSLFIGNVTSLFASLFITRYVYELISLMKKLKKLSI